jgi:hypothetical protein
MGSKLVFAAMSLALAVAPLLYTTTSAFPKCNVSACQKLGGKHSRSEVQAACQGAGGIEAGTTATSGNYGCYTDGGSFVECDGKGECVGGPGQAVVPDPRQGLEQFLRAGSSPVKK